MRRPPPPCDDTNNNGANSRAEGGCLTDGNLYTVYLLFKYGVRYGVLFI